MVARGARRLVRFANFGLACFPNPEVEKETAHDKGIVLDVRARLQDGRLFNVEMQSQRHLGLRSRALLYWSRVYAGQLQRGDGYEALVPTISLFILDFNELPTAHFHSEFRLLEVKSRFPFSDDLTLHVLELPKVPGLLGTQSASPSQDEPLLAKWGRFLKATTKEQLKDLAMNDPIFQDAKSALEELSSDPKAQALAEERRLGAYFYEQSLRLAEEKGRAEGSAKRARDLLAKQISLKLGSLPDDAALRLQHASDEDVDRWAERILTAGSLAEVFEG